MTGSEAEREFRLGWSLWRRAHQAVAKRCHAAQRALQKRETPPPPRRFMKRATGRVFEQRVAPLTDAEWELIRHLLPPQKPPSGRPRRDHRAVLSGILWVLGTSSSWRDLPEEEFGPWQTIYGRYRKWHEEGLWQRITEALRCC
jgi:Putative transposase of IS4/5 family (DUF4096)